jgi:hypothetical protein
VVGVSAGWRGDLGWIPATKWQYRAKQDKTWAEFNCPFRAEVCIGGARQRREKAGSGKPVTPAKDFRNSETLCSQFICR